jgi:hypothetical protein
MILKNITKLEIEIAGKMYHLLCDQDSPIEHVKESLFQFLKYVGQIEDAIKQQAQKSAEEKKESEVK